MATLADLGTDIDRQWTFNEQMDIKLTENEDNLTQAIINRLNCFYDRLGFMYEDYGSFLHSYLGWIVEDETLEFIRLEIETTLEQDPRIIDPDITVEYVGDGEISILLTIELTEEDDLELNLLLSNEGVTIVETEDNVEEDLEDGD